jgi:uncharacterized membrane protein YvlD (DUF360 family)
MDSASMFSFILKVLIASAAISVGIKRIGPLLAIPASPTVILTLVLLPTVLMGLALSIQYRTQRR